MLDIWYASISEFTADCLRIQAYCKTMGVDGSGYDPIALVAKRDYIVQPDGSVVAKEWAEWL